MNSAANQANEKEIVILREFDAPRDLVWKVWTEAGHVAKWWGPKGFTTRVEELDVRPGGKSRYVMVDGKGQEYPVQGIFREVTPPESFVTTDEFEEGYDYPDMDSDDLPRGVILTCTFEDLGPKTRVTLRITHRTVEERRKHEDMGVVGGWQSSFECMDEYLATLQ